VSDGDCHPLKNKKDHINKYTNIHTHTHARTHTHTRARVRVYVQLGPCQRVPFLPSEFTKLILYSYSNDTISDSLCKKGLDLLQHSFRGETRTKSDDRI